jgi:hypothetical protein
MCLEVGKRRHQWSPKAVFGAIPAKSRRTPYRTALNVASSGNGGYCPFTDWGSYGESQLGRSGGSQMKLKVGLTDERKKPLANIWVRAHDVTAVRSPRGYAGAPVLVSAQTTAKGIAAIDLATAEKLEAVEAVAFSAAVEREGQPVFVSAIVVLAETKDGARFDHQVSGAHEPGDSVAGRGDLPSYADHVAKRLAGADARGSALRGAASTVLKKKRDGRNLQRVRARQYLKHPTKTLADRSKSELADGKDGEALAAKLRKEALDRFRSAAGRRRGIVVRGDEETIAALVKRKEIPIGELDGLVFPNGRTGARYVNQLLEDCAAETLQQTRGPGENADGTGTKSASTAEVAVPAALRNLSIDERLNRILGDLDQGNLAARPDVVAIAESLQREFSPGPADTTAYYDFHSLQVAWKSAWMALADGMAAEQLAELLQTVGQVIPDDKIDADLSEIADLEDLLRTLAGAAADADEVLDIPDTLRSWLPEIGEHAQVLTSDNVDYLRFLAYVEFRCRDEHPTWRGERNTRRFSELFFAGKWWPDEWEPKLTVARIVETDWAAKTARTYLQQVVAANGSGVGRLKRLIASLQNYLAEPYCFDVFVPGTHNFGIATTYRQKWQPRTYQAGSLVGTVPLAPGEVRKLSVKKSVKRESSRSDKSVGSLSGSRDTSETGRMEGEITRRANQAMNVGGTVVAGSGGVANAASKFSATGNFGFDQGSESAIRKSEIRESVRKAAQEYKDERTVEISEKVTGDTETTQQIEIRNPNSEITVTYLFYELQRRFEVSERLHDVRPVVMVAFDVPAPNRIDEGWLVRHEWILRKALLDSRLEPALSALSSSFAGDELAVETLKQQWRAQMAVVSELRMQAGIHHGARERARQAVAHAIRAADAEEPAQGSSGLDFFKSLGFGHRLADALFTRRDDGVPEISGAHEAAKQALDWIESDLSSADGALREAVSALDGATSAYVAAVRQQADRKIAVDQLRAHVKQNILHYMQAIWTHEHRDQRYLRLYDMEISWPEPDGTKATVKSIGKMPGAIGRMLPGHGKGKDAAALLVMPAAKLGPTRLLDDVADLNRLLGFFGNYAVFELKEANALTDYMLQDFLDTEFGLHDPDPDAPALTADEALDIAHCAWRRLEGDDKDSKKAIADWLLDSLRIAHRRGQEIVLPTGELFIEALPGERTLLEDFKLMHRAFDASRAHADAQIAALEALRRAARIQSGDFSDPDADAYEPGAAEPEPPPASDTPA